MNKDRQQFIEVPSIDPRFTERLSTTDSLWYRSPEDVARRQCFEEFFEEVSPAVEELLQKILTRKQYETVKYHYRYRFTQERIAEIMEVSQSTVSRHIHGTYRNGRIVGGAMLKLRRIISGPDCPAPIAQALNNLQNKLSLVA